MNLRKITIIAVLFISFAHASPKVTPTFKIVLDPGHGGSDQGTVFHSITEKDLALIYAQRIQAKIEALIPDSEVFLTRKTDTFVSLPNRATTANNKKADLFISIHVNHAHETAISGVETYILSPDATDDQAKQLALLENESWSRALEVPALKTGNSSAIQKIFVDMEQTKVLQRSALAASMIHQEISRLELPFGLKNRGVKQAMFYVLSQVAAPSVLVEIGFLSNPGDRERLMNFRFQQEFIQSLALAIKRYQARAALKEF